MLRGRIMSLYKKSNADYLLGLFLLRSSSTFKLIFPFQIGIVKMLVYLFQ